MAEQVQAKTTIAGQETQSVSLLDSIINTGKMAKYDRERDRAKDLIGELVDQLLDGAQVINQDVEATIKSRIADIDKLLSDQVNAILHHEDFQRLEGTWRGLHKLVHESETSQYLKIRVLNAKKKELYKDLKKAAEFDQSGLFKKIYEEEFGVFGGAPFGVLIGDYQFGRHPQDIELLEKMSGVAAAAHSPFVSAPAPDLLNMESFTEIPDPRDLAKIFSSPEYVQWRAFRESEDSRYVALTLPRYLSRLPYGPDTVPVEDFHFVEEVDGTDHNSYLWSSSAYLYGTRLTDAFAKVGWTVGIRGVEGGGMVEGLPVHNFKTEDGETTMKIPTEVVITGRRENELSELGFIPLVNEKGNNKAVFFGGQTVQKPASYKDADANANAQLSARLPYIFAVSRIAHYLKAIVRDKIGTFSSPEEMERFLKNWIKDYVLLADNASQEMKERKPLREAKIQVVEIPGQPGKFRAVARVKPHIQLEGVNVSLRLVANMPEGAG